MAEAKSRREMTTPPRPRPRPKSDVAFGNGEEHGPSAAALPPRTEPPAPVPPEAGSRDGFAEDDYAGFDEEINSRYEEIKRGGTHISELQQMTMPQLLKVAKEEGLTDYTGLKKQDLIFKILK